MDSMIDALREEISAAKANEKTFKASLSGLNATMSTSELQDSIAKLTEEKAELLNRLGPLRAGTLKPVSKSEKEDVDKQWKEWGRIVSARRRIVKELWERVLDMRGDFETAEDREELWVSYNVI